MKKILLILFLIQPLYAVDFYEMNVDGNSVFVDVAATGNFQPRLKMNKWNNEEFLALIFKGGIFNRHKLENNRVVIDNNNIKLEYYTIEGSIKMVVTLLKKPPVNTYSLEMEGWENFDFFYQPPLTQEEIDEGHIRPDKVVGSYAVYHKTKRNHEIGKTNYQTGKFCHIYRPKAVDINGNFAWVDLLVENGNYTVSISQDFLNTAQYPVIINDEFGYHADGGSVDTQSSDQLSAQVHYSMAGNGDVTAISAYCGSSQFCLLQCAVYHRIDAVPDTYKGVSEQEENWNGSGATDLNDFAVSPSFALTADDYAIVIWSDTGYWLDYDAGTAYGIDNTAHAAFSWSSPWSGTDRARNYNYCIWVTYTPSTGGAKPAASQILILE